MARLQRVYLYYSYAVFAVLLFTAWRQYQFALFLLLSFILLTCNAVMKRLARLAKDRYAEYANIYASPMGCHHARWAIVWLDCVGLSAVFGIAHQPQPL